MVTGRLTGRARTLSMIIPATYSTDHLQRQIAVSQSLEPLEIILAASAPLISRLPSEAKVSCKIIAVGGEADFFAGRAAGAAMAKGDILLFLGEDRYYSTSSLQRFLFPLRYGQTDAMLARVAERERGRQRTKPVHCFSRLLNELCDRADLQEASLLDSPHAMKRAVLHRLGPEILARPAEAHRQLVSSRMTVQTMLLEPQQDDVPFQPQLAGTGLSACSEWEQAAVAEHLRVWSSLPWRGGLSDGGRRRDIAERYAVPNSELPIRQRGRWPLRQTELYGGKSLSVIIPACNEEKTIAAVLREVLRLAPAEIIVVVNGSRDRTAQIARQHQVTVVEFAEALGVDTGRAVGASLARGEWLLFVDADFVIPAMDLYPFVRACQLGADVALNDQSRFLSGQAGNVITAARLALNVAAKRRELGCGSMLVVPFALRRESFAPLGWPLLACPPKAQLAAAWAGLDIRLAHEVDSFAQNRLRPEKHLAPNERPPAVKQLLGDHLEAFQLLAERGAQRQEGEGSGTKNGDR